MQEQSLLEKLQEYGASDYVPFHMPGHKRETSLGITAFPNPFSVDITEIEGFDNLHHAEGILKTSMERAAEIYGADASWYLVNGSTSGILTAVCALTTPGGRILMARNCHKSAYHAAMLHQLDPIFVYPEELEDEACLGRGILGGVDPKKIEQILEKQTGRECRKKRIQAVFLTSPTYEGIVSDVHAIAEIVHRYKIPLIVDEAHGAHFPFGEEFPSSALECGADVVIQSLHKTLPSLTQTAVLHVKSSLVDSAEIERYLPVFQSSSPSYVFLSAIENCIFYMAEEGRKRMEEYAVRLKQFRKEAKALRRIWLMEDEGRGRNGVFARDSSKLVLLPPTDVLDGTAFAERLRAYHLEPEMACKGYVILMTSLMDGEQNFSRLFYALKKIDCALEEMEKKTDRAGGWRKEEKTADCVRTWLENPVCQIPLFQAWNGEQEPVLLAQAAGRAAGSFVTVYPPGVPMLIPGEEITPEAISLIQENQKLGLTVEGIKNGQIFCLKVTD